MFYELDIFRDILAMYERLSRVLELARESAPRPAVGEAAWEPCADVIRGRAELLLRVELPGVSMKDVRLELTGDTLTISGERRRPELMHNGRFRRMEGRYGKFRRSFQLPTGVAGEGIDAALGNGVLEVRLPLGEEEPVRTEIDIK